MVGNSNLLPLLFDLFQNILCTVNLSLEGGAVFFAKQPSLMEVINDTNDFLMNFYSVVKTDFKSLEKLLQTTLCGRTLYRHAKVIYENPDMFDKVKRAWAVWYLANSSFGHKLDGGWRQAKGWTYATLITKQKDNAYKSAQRLERVELENRDALKIIKSKDSTSTFFYIDPPYVGSDLGHYDGYSQEDFNNLLEMLSTIQGKFLLSSYPNKVLQEYTERFNWSQSQIKLTLSMANRSDTPRYKTEVLTANYPLDDLEPTMTSDELF